MLYSLMFVLCFTQDVCAEYTIDSQLSLVECSNHALGDGETDLGLYCKPEDSVLIAELEV